MGEGSAREIGPDGPVAGRNILGVIHTVGLEFGGKVILGDVGWGGFSTG